MSASNDDDELQIVQVIKFSGKEREFRR